MIIRSDSRFRNAALYTVQPGDARYWGLPVRARLENADEYVTHYVSENERLDQIAASYYGNPYLQWVLAEVNDLFRWWDELEVGAALKIPTREALARIFGA